MKNIKITKRTNLSKLPLSVLIPLMHKCKRCNALVIDIPTHPHDCAGSPAADRARNFKRWLANN